VLENHVKEIHSKEDDGFLNVVGVVEASKETYNGEAEETKKEGKQVKPDDVDEDVFQGPPKEPKL